MVRKKILDISAEDIVNYVNSSKYKKLKEKLISYRQNKENLRDSKLDIGQRIVLILRILKNRYFWENIFEKFSMVWRKFFKIQ